MKKATSQLLYALVLASALGMIYVVLDDLNMSYTRLIAAAYLVGTIVIYNKSKD